MNKDKAKLLEEAVDSGQKPEDCNIPELAALLKTGDKIKDSALNNQAPDANFKERLKADILAKRHANAFSMKFKITESWSNFRASFTRQRMVPALAIFVLIAVIAVSFKFWPGAKEFSPLTIEAAYARDNFTVEPTAGGDLGVDSSTQFIIKSKTAINDINVLRANIKLSPETDFDLKAVSAHEFRLTPKTNLADKKVYQVVIASSYINGNNLTVDRNYSWAFQVKDKFKVVGSIPADKSTAPVNSGVEIIFSTENFSGFEQAFSISPEVKGRFEKHNRTMVFIPEKPFATSTLYTVNVAPTVINDSTKEPLAESYHFQFQIQKDQYDQNSFSFSDDAMAEFSTKSSVAFAVNSVGGVTVATKIYNYRSLNEFTSSLKKYYEIPAWAREARQSYVADFSNLSLAASYDLNLNNTDRGNFLVLPNNLPAGFYVIEATVNGKRSSVFFQVSDLSAYTAVSTNKILFWVNDLNGEKNSGVKVTELNTNISKTTDNNGLVAFDAPADLDTTGLFTVESGDKSLVVNGTPGYIYKNQNAEVNNNYWNYLYTDRALYQPNDEINFWGFVKPRTSGEDVTNKEITVSLTNNSFDFYMEPKIIVEQKVVTDNRGYYIGKLKLNDVTQNGYNLQVKLNGKNINSDSYINVSEYIKPSYKINITPSAKAIFSGEKIKYAVQASFFEGTVLANKELNIDHHSSGNKLESTSATTDSKGQVNLEYDSKCACDQNSCDFCYDTLAISPKLSEQGDISANGSMYVFRTHERFDNLSATRVGQENRVRVKANLYNVDLNNDKTWNGAPVGNKKVTAIITSTEYIATQSGTYYDYINKVTYPVYDYTQKMTDLPAQAFVTAADGSGVLEFNINPKYSYKIRLITNDNFNNQVVGEQYFSNIYDYNNDPRYDYYNITEDVNHEKGYYIGEKVNLTIKRKNTEITNPSGKYLFATLQNGLQDYTVKTDPKFNFSYSEKNVPNVYISGVWFDGKTYHEAGVFTAYFNKENKKLNIEIKTDKEKYKPGEEAVLNISVKDKDGHGVKTQVNVSAVDAALASLGGINEPMPLDRLYQFVESGLRFTEYTHKDAFMGGGGAEGGGGGNNRSYFPDMALFTQVETGEGGQATLKFKLPDNITSWELNAQTITGDLEAGATTTQLKVSLPLFVDPNFEKQYITGDEPIVKISGYGEALKMSDMVQTYLEAPTLGINHDVKNVAAFAPAYFNLGTLNPGQYGLKMGANFNNYQDSILATTTVISSRLSERKSLSSEIKTGGLIAGSDKNWTTITLMDNNRGRYFTELLNLSYQDGARLDQKLSVALASDLLKNYFAENSYQEKPNLKIYQKPDGGGISLLPYSTADLKVSVLAAMAQPDSFDRAALSDYFYGIYNNKESNLDEIALALSGLAALDEPVLIPLREFSRQSDLTPIDKLYLALGAQAIGDDSLASNIYNDLVSKYGEQPRPYLRLNIDPKNNDNNSIATALASILAAGLDDGRAENLWSYAKENLPSDELTSIERLLYLKKAVPNIPAGASKFTLKVDGTEISKELKRGENYRFQVSPAQLKTLNINIASGNILAISDFEGAADFGNINSDVSVTRTYWNNNKESTDFKESDIVEIRIKPQFKSASLDGSYEITDILPSGLKLLTNTYSPYIQASCNVWYPYEMSGQKVKFVIDKSWNTQGDCKRDYITYFARVSNPGKFKAESALIQSVKSADVKNFSSDGQINIIGDAK